MSSFTCKVCDMKLASEHNLRAHVATHSDDWVCPECKVGYKRRSMLLRHIREKHPHLFKGPGMNKRHVEDDESETETETESMSEEDSGDKKPPPTRMTSARKRPCLVQLELCKETQEQLPLANIGAFFASFDPAATRVLLSDDCPCYSRMRELVDKHFTDVVYLVKIHY